MASKALQVEKLEFLVELASSLGCVLVHDKKSNNTTAVNAKLNFCLKLNTGTNLHGSISLAKHRSEAVNKSLEFEQSVQLKKK